MRGFPGVPHSEPDVAAVLERLGFAFTGASSRVLSLAHDKPHGQCAILEANGLPTPPWAVFDTPGIDGWSVFPAIVKAANEHCSIGISPESVVTSRAEALERRVGYILSEHRQPVLVEEFIDGREFHVAAWGNGNVTAMPAAEMDYVGLTDIRDRLFTYDAKYVPGSRLYETIELRVPAALDPPARAVQRIVLATYRATGCRDYGRIDLRFRDGVFYVIDVNPNPDINPLTSLTYAAAEIGYSYGELGSRIVNLAAARHPVYRTA